MTDLLIYLCKAAAIQTILYLCYITFFSRDTFFMRNRIMLLACIILPYILPFITIPIDIFSEPVVEEPVIFYGNVTYSDTLVSDKGFDYKSFVISTIPYLYIFGIAILTIITTISYRKLYDIIKRSVLYKRDSHNYYVNPDTVSPFSFLNNIVVPKSEVNSNNLKNIECHEKIHSRHFHSVDMILTDISKIFLWFNPISWFIKYSVIKNNEYIVDEVMLSEGVERKNYQYSLLNITIGAQRLAMVNTFSNNLKNRIKMMNSMKTPKLYAIKNLIVLPILIAILFLTSAFATNANEVANKNSINSTKISEDLNNDKDSESKKVTYAYNVIVKDKKDKKDKKKKKKKKKVYKSTTKKVTVTVDDDGKTTEEVVVTTDSNDDEHIVINNGKIKVRATAEIHDGDKEIEIFTTKKGDANKIKIVKKDGVTKYYLNDKEVGKDEIQKISKIYSENIKTIHVTKGSLPNEDSEIKMNIKSDNGKSIVIFSDDKDNSEKIPYVVIDGVEASHDEMQKLDPKNIEAISVLKGNSAEKLYGSKAENGALIITTKKK